MIKRNSDTVLVVNDDTDQLQLLEKILDAAGYRVLKANNGGQGLELALSNSPDLVVSDVMMPVMNGIELCRRMREIPYLQRVPVLLVSALRVDSESAVEGFRAGADDYLEAPFEQARFIAKVERLFERKRDEEAHIQLLKAQHALRESRTELAYVKLALDESAIVAVTDGAGNLTSYNDKFCEIVKYPRERLRGQNVRLLQTDHHPPEFFDALWKTVRGGGVWKGEIRCVAADGALFWLETAIVPVLGDDRRPQKFISLSQDITENKDAEARLLRSETYHRALIENASDLISILDADGRIRYQSPAVGRLLGFTAEELEDRNVMEFIDPDDLEKAGAALRRVVENPAEPVAVEVRLRHQSGRSVYFACTLTNLLDNPAINGIVSNAFDITERKRAEEALRESESRYRILFNHNPLPMWVVDAETDRFLAVNDAAVRHYGFSHAEFTAMTSAALNAPGESDALDADGEENNSPANLRRHLKKDCSVIDVEINAHALSFGGRPAQLVLINDVTEKRWATRALRQSEEQLRQAQKLESVGRLAGGIAHDFNNMLTAINGYSDLLLAQLPFENPLRRNVEEIKKAGLRSAELTRQLLAFSRRTILQPKIFDLNKVISETMVMLQRLIGEDLHLIASLSPEVGPIEADPGQISQVIMNLVVNSRDAMPHGGTIVIETESLRFDETYDERQLSLKAGEYVMLAVSDTGFGMDEETQSHMFEPFFTTKEMGKGTGLGLSTVYGIVKQSGGHIWVYSEVGKGTTVKIYLPRVAKPEQPYEKTESAEHVVRGTETILLVEDEEVVRKLSREILELCGYKVIEAENGIVALALCERYRNRIDLLMTDVVMPQMGGRELAQILLQTYPDLRVLFTSGYTDDAIIRHGILDIGTNFIQKPFTFENLTRKIRNLLDNPVEPVCPV